jgi:ATP-binding cassette, subfamily B, bacterial PglK
VTNVYSKLFSLLDARERRRGVIVLALLVVVAFVEVLGVASIMPFIAVLANPEVVETNRYLGAAYRFTGVESVETFLFLLGLLFFLLLVASLVLKALGAWAQLRFSHNRNFAWGSRLVGGYLRQPYEWFLNRHSADLATEVLVEVGQVVNGSLFPSMQIIANALVTGLLMALLIAVDPFLAFAMGVLLGGGYALISVSLRRRLCRIGLERKQAQRRRFHAVHEAFGGIKDVKIAGLEETFLHRFRVPAKTLASRQISAGLISQLPSFAMQGLLFGGMLLVLLYLLSSHGGFQEALPVIAVYAYGGYRLMPSIQNIYQALSQLRFSEAALDGLCEDFAFLDTGPRRHRRADAGVDVGQDRVRLEHQLEIDCVSYRYPGADRPALQDLSLTISANTTVGLVGATGSGKTTAVDLLMCLLRPQRGTIRVDGIDLTEELIRRWQRSIGYVPQQIFLSDDTVASNIAFGLPPDRIDMNAVERAAKIANLHDFVVGELPGGYETRVGERGVRLSGGQRQRIGIARALYHAPDLLIMDEATSALDNLTEQAVMEAIHKLGGRKTIVLIAHRLTTVRTCDCIYVLEGGRIVGQGTYEELIAGNERFRALAEAVS